MDATTSLPPAGRLEGGGVRFYSFAPEGWRFRIFEEIRTPSRKASRPIRHLVATFEDAEAFVREINGRAVRR